MDTLRAIAAAIGWFHGARVILLAVPLTLLLHFAFRRRAQLGRHAIQNISATLVFVAINHILSILFFREINAVFQAAYALLRIPTLPADIWAGLPLGVVVLMGIVAKDFVDYWNHRLMHTRWFWPAHAAHHSDTHVNAFTTFRIHILQSCIMSFSYILLLTWLQMPKAIPFVVVLAIVHNMYVHMDLEWDHGRFRFLLASPVFHRWHHADLPAAYGKNLANVIPLWDRLFGTYIAPGLCRAPMGALRDGLSDKNPLLIFLYPFQEWARLVRGKEGAAAGRPDPSAPPVVPAIPPAE